MFSITVMPSGKRISAAPNMTLLAALQAGGVIIDAPCGGEGKCGKCRVILEGREVLACAITVDRDMTVLLPQDGKLTGATGSAFSHNGGAGLCLAFDIGTTTVVGWLLKDGNELAAESRSNPQKVYGGDVISRIRMAVKGQQEALSACIRGCVEAISLSLCEKAGVKPAQIQRVSIVGNPAMGQFFLGLGVENLASPPFGPKLTEAKTLKAKDYLPAFENATLLNLPDMDGFVGSDTLACILASRMKEEPRTTLLVDIGTNAEMVLGNCHKMIACSAAAGPALEGAGIQMGMRAEAGAIDHIKIEGDTFSCSVIGNVPPVGICGSGLIDAVAGALELGLLNERGKILTEDGLLHLTEHIYLTQEDIRQVQLAKGAIAAGIHLMAKHMGISLHEIDKVFLCGAFGSFLEPASACRIGLLPRELEGKIIPAGNAAGVGAKILAANPKASAHAETIAASAKVLELSSLRDFPRCFAKHMRF